MAPEYGATASLFPIDAETLDYLRLTGRTEERIALVETYTKAQRLFRTDETPEPRFNQLVELDLADVAPSVAGPRRPQDRLPSVRDALRTTYPGVFPSNGAAATRDGGVAVAVDGVTARIDNGAVVIAAITSCTNTSNPSVMLGAGLLARKAVELGLDVPGHVKTSLAPGSQVVTRYLTQAGLLPYLEALGFHVVGYGCTTCIGNSGPLPEPVSRAVEENELVVSAVLSGNRNFEGRIHSQVRAAFLASRRWSSPTRWPARSISISRPTRSAAIRTASPSTCVTSGRRRRRSGPLSRPRSTRPCSVRNTRWSSPAMSAGKDSTCRPATSTSGARTRRAESALLPEHRRRAGSAGRHPRRAGAGAPGRLGHDRSHLSGGEHRQGQPSRSLPDRARRAPHEFNSYGSRRGNHEVMIRGTFANIRLRNQLVGGKEGNWTVHLPTGEEMRIYDAAMRYIDEGTPLLVIGGKEYGTGSSRDWAAKGTLLLGVKAVLVESFERIHRSNLVGMGVLPLQFLPGENASSLGLTGEETFDVLGLQDISPRQRVHITATRPNGDVVEFDAIARIDSPVEVEYFRNGGILQTVLRRLTRSAA